MILGKHFLFSRCGGWQKANKGSTGSLLNEIDRYKYLRVSLGNDRHLPAIGSMCESIPESISSCSPGNKKEKKGMFRNESLKLNTLYLYLYVKYSKLCRSTDKLQSISNSLRLAYRPLTKY